MEQLQEIMSLFSVLGKDEITDEEALKLGRTYFNMMKSAMKIDPNMLNGMNTMMNNMGDMVNGNK